MAAAPWVSPPPGPWSHRRNFQAAACWSAVACALTTVSHAYETLAGADPWGPTGIGAVATLSKSDFIAVLRALSHQLAMTIIAVFPLVKLSRNGPVVFALEVPMAGSVTLSLLTSWS